MAIFEMVSQSKITKGSWIERCARLPYQVSFQYQNHGPCECRLTIGLRRIFDPLAALAGLALSA